MVSFTRLRRFWRYKSFNNSVLTTLIRNYDVHTTLYLLTILVRLSVFVWLEHKVIVFRWLRHNTDYISMLSKINCLNCVLFFAQAFDYYYTILIHLNVGQLGLALPLAYSYFTILILWCRLFVRYEYTTITIFYLFNPLCTLFITPLSYTDSLFHPSW